MLWTLKGEAGHRRDIPGVAMGTLDLIHIPSSKGIPKDISSSSLGMQPGARDSREKWAGHRAESAGKGRRGRRQL